ncbi:MAG TPA: PBP1A family penicillin-binding protein [Gemmatimonadales bacterium]|nr:PBP1A family penicillin-binding protein [Gemmatimonadales bacterium]
MFHPTRTPLRTAIVAALLASVAPQAAAQETTEAWRMVPQPQATLVLARDGSLIGEFGPARRWNVPLASLPRYVSDAFIAIEDQRFYEHDGVDLVGIAGALKDAATRGDVRGASTITQQLVGNMHPELVDRSDMSLARKLREQQAAREMERNYTKQQILEAYLNQLDFGRNWFGIEMASLHYFGKPAARLLLHEAATLAAIINGPGVYDPYRYPQRVKQRRDLVLGLMAQQGQITREQAELAKREALQVHPERGFSVRAPYVTDVVRVQAERAGVPVRSGGFRIFTTIDPALQLAADSALSVTTRELEAQPGWRFPVFANRTEGRSDYLQGAVVSLDASSGHVRALVGGRDYGASQFNRAIDARRQPGSSFKPFVYATAIADSMPPNTMVGDTAISIPVPGSGIYRPTNADNRFLGMLTMREALVRSRNPVAVSLATELGMDEVAATAYAAGLDSPIAPYPSSALGASVVQPLDMAAAYLVFDNGGVRMDPRFVLRVEDLEGRVVWQPDVRGPVAALDVGVSFMVRDMLREAVDRGTATSVRRFLPASVPAAGKTGTTNDNTDVWFVGMTPELVTAVWLGFDQPRPMGSSAAGGTIAAPVFGRMMAAWYAGREAGNWEPPPSVLAVQLDRETGQPPNEFTPESRVYTEYFLHGTEPGRMRASPWVLFRAGPVVF